MKKQILHLILSVCVLILVFFIYYPRFSTDYLDRRQREENELNFKRQLQEKIARKEAEDAEQKIYLTGKFDPAQREDFVLIPAQFTLTGNNMYLRKEAFEAYLKMKNAADLVFVDLKIVSAARNFDYQKGLWNNKWTGAEIVDGENLSISFPDGLERFKKILEYSAVPGISRHHWGTDIDINNVNPSYFNGYKGAIEYEWLTKNAYLYGFCQTYNKKGPQRVEGYKEEKWHWSYLPLARDFTQKYKNLIKDEDINGFLGDEFVPELDLINNYILSINPDCV